MSRDLALPWGKLPEDKSMQALDNSHETPTELSLDRGERIEVQWQLSDEDGDNNVKWWGAELIEAIEEQISTWKLRYDASDGFDPEEATVRFISPDTLERQEDCCQEEKFLKWRREGDADADADAGEDEGDHTVGIHALREEQDEEERETGQNLEQAALDHMQQQMAPDQQQYLLAGFRQFADHFKSQLQELVGNKENSEGYVVTASDVQNIVAGLKK